VTAVPDPWAKIPTDAPTIVSGSTAEPLAEPPPRLLDEAQPLLQTRLRAVAWLVLLAFTLYLARSFIVPGPDLRLFQAVNVVVAGAMLLLLRERRLSLPGLRGVELVLFGLLAAFLATNQAATMLPEIHAGNVPRLHTAMRSSALYWFAAIVAYGMLVPNTWPRAASVVAPLALAPVAMTLALRSAQPLAAEAIKWTQVSDMALMLTVGSIAAIYGTHIITGLQLEVFTARQLGQYRLKKLLGAGGMGDVYLAEHELLKRPCVVKLIRAGRADNPELLAHFEREVRTTASLTHWNTVEVWDYGATSDGTFYYVMEYLPGWNLADLVARFGPLPAGRAVYLLEQVCGALGEAHAVGFLHRDVTPANIIATFKGGRFDVAKLLDFGLVKIVGGSHRGRSTKEDGLSSSNEYRAPEQAAGGVIDPRSDLYSLAAVGCYLLTGSPPTREGGLPSAVPADLQQVILRGMAPQPEDRYAGADEFAQALKACRCETEWTHGHAAQWWHGQPLDSR
jgi:eukaryotic-like serine/threonine-protein kinase